MNQSHGAIHHDGTDQILARSVNHSTVVVQQQTPQQGCRSISPRDVGELLEIFLRVIPGELLARRSFERKKKDGNTPSHGEPQMQIMNPATTRGVCISPPCVSHRTLPPRHHTASTDDTNESQKAHANTSSKTWMDRSRSVLWQPISTDSLNPAWRVPHDSWRHAMKFGTEGGVHRHGTPIPQHKHPLFSHVCAFVREPPTTEVQSADKNFEREHENWSSCSQGKTTK